MDTTTTRNPYGPADPLAPFAGRQAELARLDQYLKDPAPGGALVFLGRHWLGKTALLRRFDSVFDDLYVGVDLALIDLPLTSENALIHAIIDGTSQALARRDVTLARIPTPDLDMPILRDWFAETWLPGVFHVIRPHRKLVLLIDDAQVWLDAESGDAWPGDTFDFFDALLRQQTQFKLVMTFLAEREEDLPRMRPLVTADQVLRLAYLPAEATRWLLRYPGLYAVPDDSVDAVQRATGGHPQLVQRFAAHIYQYQYSHPDAGTITPEMIRALLPGVYTSSVDELATLWADSTDMEQLILLAISRMRYDDPLKAINADTISTWLMDSDYPLDRTAVNAALRALEYREVVVHRGSGLEFTSAMLQTWLMENTPHGASDSGGLRLRRPVVIAALVVIVLAVFLLVSLSNTPQASTSATAVPAPTVTLANQASE